ncbi:MAG: APC family permease [Blastocatellia bacterium]
MRFTPVLGLWALVMFGIAFVGPTAPYTMHGLGSAKSQGHFALVYLIGMLAMSFTAFSYARMATAFPEAGSTYAYASRTLHPVLGYFGGWVMILDYIMLPLISIVIVSSTAHKLLPEVPYVVWALLTAAFGTGLNLFGIRVTSRATIVWNAMLAVSLLWFFTAAARALLNGAGHGTLLSLEPFYNPATFSLSAVMSATPIAVLSFLGFDGVSTLAEDAKNPRRDIGLATVLTCFTCGILFILGTYLGQLLWPDFTTFHSQETAFSEIGRRISGPALGGLISAFVVGQALMAVIASQASASRMLFGMARDGKLPRAVFAYLHPRLNTPVRSILLMGVICLIGALLMNLEQAADLVNFGACLGFISVNLSALAYGFFHRRERRPSQLWRSLLSPLIGFAICSWIWLSVSKLAMIVGFVWLGLGALHHASLKFSAGQRA